MQELERHAIEEWTKMQKHIKAVVEAEDAARNQEIRACIEKSVADIARKCGTTQDEVWEEMNYWSNRKL